MNNRIKYVFAAVIATAAGLVCIQGLRGDVPSDFRDAAAEEKKSGNWLKELVYRNSKPFNLSKAVPMPVIPKKNSVVFPPRPVIKLSPAQMKRLLSLAQYAHDSKLGGGIRTRGHDLEFEEGKGADSGFQLKRIRLSTPDSIEFTVYPDGSVDNKVTIGHTTEYNEFCTTTNGLHKDRVDILMKEVDFWMNYSSLGVPDN